MTIAGNIVALSGGVGGAKLATGLANLLPPGRLTIIANTADDFEYHGLHISPDIDSLMYALAGVNNPDTGWGRDVESWTFMSELERLGLESWFRLGDRDLAVHVYRTSCLKSGRSLSSVTEDLCARFGIGARIAPMSDDAVGTVVRTDVGELPFQEYFVRRQCRPSVKAISFAGADDAAPSPRFLAALEDPGLAGIVICPSNPWLSIDPILSLPGAAAAIADSRAPVAAVSPIVQGKSIKGPTARIMADLGIPVSASSVARHYATLVDAFVLDSLDESIGQEIADHGIAVEIANTVMGTADDRKELARRVLGLLSRMSGADLR